jgi:hypothetical protein
MIIDKIHVESVAIFKPENDPPIRADSHREKALPFPLEAVQAKDRQVHALNLLRRVQSGENEPNSLQHIRRQFTAVVVLKKPPQAFVPEGLYHQKPL